VRQCFALPLLFFVFCFYFFALHKQIKRNKKNQSGRAKHCRTPKNAKPKKDQLGGDSAVFFAILQGNTSVAKVSNPCFTYRFLNNRLTQKGQKSS
jgi:hypothetical protein